MSRPRIAVSVMPLDNRRDALMALAETAERVGYDAFWLPETWAFDTTILLAEAATRTRRIELGTGILGVWNRSAATIAMAAASLQALSGGRFVLGLGASTPQLVEGLHDVRFEAPLGRVRRTISQVRALLAGDRVPLAVTTGARALRLNVPKLAAPPPIHLAAIGDAAVRLAGEIADGWIPFLYPLCSLPGGVALLREGAARGGHADRVPPIHVSTPAVVTGDPDRARAGAAWFVSFYVVSMGTFYRDTLVRHGFGKAVAAVLAANAPKFQGAVPAEAEDLLEQLVVYGTPAEARRRLARWHAAGAATVALLLAPNLSRPEMEDTLEAFRPVLESPIASA
ncbi:MAG: LLM class flavin-dependent oxidoreductase [Candidatus Rokubacteria bacterium]|nr:LLM class flavin-dependent oxidoreductase [Candidatus Rokubacteria bacterium]MBI3826044.1 LLM class flavin-dependent oxidoreductase [Candidatus Rokubacteria bacterium]